MRPNKEDPFGGVLGEEEEGEEGDGNEDGAGEEDEDKMCQGQEREDDADLFPNAQGDARSTEGADVAESPASIWEPYLARSVPRWQESMEPVLRGSRASGGAGGRAGSHEAETRSSGGRRGKGLGYSTASKKHELGVLGKVWTENVVRRRLLPLPAAKELVLFAKEREDRGDLGTEEGGGHCDGVREGRGREGEGGSAGGGGKGSFPLGCKCGSFPSIGKVWRVLESLEQEGDRNVAGGLSRADEDIADLGWSELFEASTGGERAKEKEFHSHVKRVGPAAALTAGMRISLASVLQNLQEQRMAGGDSLQSHVSSDRAGEGVGGRPGHGSGSRRPGPHSNSRRGPGPGRGPERSESEEVAEEEGGHEKYSRLVRLVDGGPQGEGGEARRSSRQYVPPQLKTDLRKDDEETAAMFGRSFSRWISQVPSDLNRSSSQRGPSEGQGSRGNRSAGHGSQDGPRGIARWINSPTGQSGPSPDQHRNVRFNLDTLDDEGLW